MSARTHFVYAPGDAVDGIRAALADKSALGLRGRGSKRNLGRPVHFDRELDLSRFSGIIAYEPEELILTAKAGTPLVEIETELAVRKQMLAFEPPEWAQMLGAPEFRSTLGGVVSAAIEGPRRFKAGGARDSLLGFSAVNGLGEIYKAGGRVVKNVTGYDLPKLMCGAFGTLGPLLDVTLKVLPAPPREDTVALPALTAGEALQSLRTIAGEPLDASGLAFVSGGLGVRLGTDRDAGESATLIRFEGAAEAVEERAQHLTARWRSKGARRLGQDISRDMWKQLGALSLWRNKPGALWRIQAPPAAASAIAAEIGPRDLQCDGAGSVLYFTAGSGTHAESGLIRGAAGRHGALATLLRAPDDVRLAEGVFHPQPEALAALSRRVKQAFDPEAVFNPGRLYEMF